MARKYHRHTLEFKRAAVERMKTCASVKALAKELEVQRRLLYQWREDLEGKAAAEMEITSAAVTGQMRQEIARLKTALADEVMKNRFFQAALQAVEARRPSRSGNGGKPCATKSDS